MKKILLFTLFCFVFQFVFSQTKSEAEATRWADSVLNSLTKDQRISQLIIVRESTFSKDGPIYHDNLVRDLITKYNIGGICMFQGTPVQQALFVNEFQEMAQTPLMVCVDGEWGLGMRFDSIIPLKNAMTLGALNDSALVYEYGRLVGRQMKRMGVQVNYAPVVDINNNPANPVINFRSFGENKYKVASYGVAYAMGMQHEGIMATAKHFPGHGDVAVDSHLDLPVINKSMDELDTLELYPFKRMIESGVASVMTGHLSVPSIDDTKNTATSISRKTVTGLLKDKLHFKGLTVTDGLGMKGVTKYFPGGKVAVQALIAGNDMLCIPPDVPDAIKSIKEAIADGRLSWDEIDEKCKKVLKYKYLYGLGELQPIKIANLTEDLNTGIEEMNSLIAKDAITLLNNQDKVFFPLQKWTSEKIAYVGIGIDSANVFASRVHADYKSDNFYFDYNEDNRRLISTVELIKKRYDKVIIGVHNYKKYPGNKFGISDEALTLINLVCDNNKTIVFNFGNPYAVQYFSDAQNLVNCYEDDPVTQSVAADMLVGRLPYKGTLPVTINPNYPSGFGITTEISFLDKVSPEAAGFDSRKLNDIDSIVNDAISKRAFPGAVVLAAKDGKIFYEKAFGTYSYDDPRQMTTESIFDLASVTKILATTISVMKLYDEGKISLDKTLGTYLPWVRNSNKSNLTIRNILLHQAGLVAYIPFYKKLIDAETGVPLPQYFQSEKSDDFSIQVAKNLYLRSDYIDSIYQIILDSKLGKANHYIYSDNDFIFLGKIVEAVSGDPLNIYVEKNFYAPMGLMSMGFNPRDKFDHNLIVPTENEKAFRMQHLHGFVHDPGAALFGGVAGHAGLYGSVENMAALLHMLSNNGVYKGKQYIQPATIKHFTAYNTSISRRGLGFDKPQKDNYTTKEARPYPSRYASPLTFGHTGYTGTCIWVDPKYDLIYVFLSNRVNPDGGENTKLITMNIRGAIEDTLYKAMTPTPPEVKKREESIKK